MVSRKTDTQPQGGNAEQSARAAGAAASAAATPLVKLPEGRKPQKGILISLRIDPIDKEKLEDVFNKCGCKLSGGLKQSALYVAREVLAGRLVMDKVGINKV
ncbi:hypothetical protein FACS189494_09390 [Spirochaetia bacterium]|nr:hypothetical protein FACS189494_09390 [Spirochaetia bacterium]